MTDKALHIIGAGGHAKVAIATAESMDQRIAGVWDSDSRKKGQKILGYTIGHEPEFNPEEEDVLFIAIGNSKIRKNLAEKYRKYPFLTLVHANTWVHKSVKIDAGSLICAGAVLQPDVKIGAHAVINTSASVDHDTVLGDYSFIGPGCHISGYCTIGNGCFLGTGSSVIDKVNIGAWSVVGAGASVIYDIPGGVVAMGVPAKVKSANDG